MNYRKSYATILFAGLDTNDGVAFFERLTRCGYHCLRVGSLAELRANLGTEAIDILLLNLYMPDGHAADFLKEMRTRSDLPAIVLSDSPDPGEEILCLEAGSDDFCTLRPDDTILLARVRALLRRAQAQIRRVAERNTLGQVEMKDSLQAAVYRGNSLELTPTEYRVLRALGDNLGVPVSRDELVRIVWDSTYLLEHRTVDIHVRNLRQKLSEHGCGLVVASVRGVGYKLSSPTDRS
ncbi:MAG: response regulator transcription factor [Candidatus Eremiobacteraeota bacterium]|nr:response regulator transcription factor [Candidatus Eremiobacteraeota bacterium]